MDGTSWVVRKAGQRYRHRKRSRSVCEQATESYLRVDISCGSEACWVCPHTLPSLAATADHYAIPDAAALDRFSEVFEVPEVANVIYLTSAIRPLLEGGNMRRNVRLRALYGDKRRRCYLFDNLHQLETAASAGPEGTASGADLLTAADWYCEHLGSRMPIVVVSDSLAAKLGALDGGAPAQQGGSSSAGAAAPGGSDEDAELEALLRQMDINVDASSAPGSTGLAVVSSSPWAGLEGGRGAASPPAVPATTAQQAQHVPLGPGVHVLSTSQYFGRYYSGSPAVLDLFESKLQAAAEEASKGGTSEAAAAGQGSSAGGGYRPHLSSAAVDSGLAQGQLLQGVLSMSRRVVHEGTVRIGGDLGGNARHVLVCGQAALNRAVHGDTVAVRLLPRERWRPAAPIEGAGEDEDVLPDETELATAEDTAEEGVTAEDVLNNSAGVGAQPTGEVVAIVARRAGEIVATIAEEDERALMAKKDMGRQEVVLCIPLDRRLPKIRLRSRQLHRMLDCRLVVRLDGWERSSRYPHGHLLRVLGPVNDLTAETDAVLVSSGVHWEPFTEGALRELPPVERPEDWEVPASEAAGRRDLRGPEHFVCSIDPPGCTDVDDALSVRWLGDGRVEVGVHIADVSHFVRQGSLLDAEAASRCTTVYLVDRRLDMLPALLSEQLCSLRGGRDRLAVSCIWVLREADLAVQSVWCGRTVIRSRYQLEYQQAQDIMEGLPPRPGHDIAPADRPTLQRALRFLARLAESRRRGRLAAGAVELESAELRFRTDQATGQPLQVDVKQEIPMMRIVAEMMIFANAAVGERIFRAFPRAALLRRHPPPRRESFAEVLPLCESVGVELDFSSNALLSASLEAACGAAAPAVATLIKSLTTRAMSEAEYFCTGDVMGRGAGMSHFGLALPFYTHFTSPIRRYADVVVHRQLLAAVAAGGAEVAGEALRPPSDLAVLEQQAPPPLPPGEVSSKAAVMNERHRTAKRAQKDCSDLYLLLLLHSTPHVEAATVYGTRGSALLVFVPKYHLKGVVHLVDTAGIAKPPLRGPGDVELQDPYVLAYRRGIAVDAGEDGITLTDTTTGASVAKYRRLQRVWVELGADGSRAHGPALRMKLLADTHPEVLEAIRQGKGVEEEAAAAPAAAAAAAAGQAPLAQQGCGALPRGMPRQSYRPPGLGLGGAAAGVGGAGARAVVARLPPGFPVPSSITEPSSATAGAAAAAVTAGSTADAAAAQPHQLDGVSSPGEAVAEGAAGGAEEEREGEQRAGLLRIDAPRTAVAAGAASAAGGGAATPATGAAVEDLMLAAVRRLRARASRYALRAAEGDPAGERAQAWEGKASRCREQLRQLEEQLASYRQAARGG